MDPIIFLGTGLGWQERGGEGSAQTDTEAAYQEQQLLEEEEDADNSDGAGATTLPPDSILDSSGDEETTHTEPLWSRPGGAAPVEPLNADQLTASTANTTHGVPTLSGPEVSHVVNSTYGVPATVTPQKPDPASPDPAPVVTPGGSDPPGCTVSAMEGVAPATYSGSPPPEYFAIKNSNKIRNSFSDLMEGEKEFLVNPGSCGSFFYPGDTREYLCDIKLDIKAGTVVSTSYNSANMSCSCCGQFMSRAGGPVTVSRAIVILSDQAFPAAVPATGGGGSCMKVYRSESASLLDIAGGFLASAGGWRLRPGSLILISSVSHLAHCGVETYAADYIAAAKLLKERTGAEIGPAPIFLLGGTDDKPLIRSLVDLATWQKRFFVNDSVFVVDAISTTISALAELGLGGRQPAYDCRYGLPSNITNPAAKKFWVSSRLTRLPEGVSPLTDAFERTIVTKMINFLNESHALNLDPAPILNRQVAAPATKGTDSVFVCVGNSHAKRTALALRRAGHAAHEVLFPAWRPTAANISTMCAELQKTLQKLPVSESTIVVLQVMDSFLYLARSEDGCVTPATKLSDGKFHVVGESILAEKDQQLRIFKLLTPLFNLAKKLTVVIVPPLPRYLDRSCCRDTGHVTNLPLPEYKKELEDQVFSCKNNLKDFAFTGGLRNCRVVAAWPAIKKRAGIWQLDPVHPIEEAYDDLAKVVIACLPVKRADKRSSTSAWGECGGDGGGANRQGKRPRLEGHHGDRSGHGYRPSYGSEFTTHVRGGRGGNGPYFGRGRSNYWTGGGGGGGGSRGGHGGRGRRGR